MTLEEAEDFCRESIMNSTVTKSCTPIISSNISDRIEDCAQDYNVSSFLLKFLQVNYQVFHLYSSLG